MNRGVVVVTLLLVIFSISGVIAASGNNIKCGLGGLFCNPNSCENKGGSYVPVIEGLYGKCASPQPSPAVGNVFRNVVSDAPYLALGCEADVQINVDVDTEPFYVVEESIPSGLNVISTDGDTRTNGKIKWVEYDENGNALPDGVLNYKISSGTPGTYNLNEGVYTLGSTVVNSIQSSSIVVKSDSDTCGDSYLTCNEVCDGEQFASGSDLCADYDPESYSGGSLLCDSNCNIDVSSCSGAPSCGDGEVNQPSEECDDQNNINGDGCSSICAVEKYYNIFVTRNSYSGRIAFGSYLGTSAADSICYDEARGYFGSKKRWKAFISSSTTNASKVLDYASPLSPGNNRYVAWKTPDKKLVARGVSDLLDGSLESGMITTIHGTSLAQGTKVWTGSLVNGQLSGVNCNNWNSNTGTGTYGVTGAIDGTWLNAGATSCNTQARIYCVEIPSCGNGIVEGSGEACDDGNTNNGDGCSTDCRLGSGGGKGTPKEVTSPGIGDLTA